MNLQALPNMPVELLRLPAFTFTWGNCYRNICPHQAYRRFILKDIPFVETDAMKEGTAVHTALEKRVGQGKVLPDEYRQWESFAACFDQLPVKVECKLGVTAEGRSCDWYDKKIFVRTKLDISFVNGETGYILDWKMGAVRENPFELEVQAVALHAANPQLRKIVGQYAWLRENRLGQMHDLSQTNRTWATICETVLDAQHDLDRGMFDKRPGKLCDWCDVKDCENYTGKNAKAPE
jgi:hypothetical protein